MSLPNFLKAANVNIGNVPQPKPSTPTRKNQIMDALEKKSNEESQSFNKMIRDIQSKRPLALMDSSSSCSEDDDVSKQTPSANTRTDRRVASLKPIQNGTTPHSDGWMSSDEEAEMDTTPAPVSSPVIQKRRKNPKPRKIPEPTSAAAKATAKNPPKQPKRFVGNLARVPAQVTPDTNPNDIRKGRNVGPKQVAQQKDTKKSVLDKVGQKKPRTTRPVPKLDDGIRKRRRSHSGMTELRKITTLMNSFDACEKAGKQRCMMKLPFQRLVREITQGVQSNPGVCMRWERSALDGLQEAAEAFITEVFEDTLNLTVYCKREEIKPADMRMTITTLNAKYFSMFADHHDMKPMTYQTDKTYRRVPVKTLQYTPPKPFDAWHQ
jgi:histone H3